ncbi:zinc-ribbon domain-containing protein [Mitsuokella multacida]|uniref:zinc-ribbon domain-containing protein n=1 Tax=Mitsuokella multacida TaxID=52226 RepID=UPI003A4D679D
MKSCSQCHSLIPDDAGFCPECGAKQPPQQVPPAQPQPAPQQVPPAQPQPGASAGQSAGWGPARTFGAAAAVRADGSVVCTDGSADGAAAVAAVLCACRQHAALGEDCLYRARHDRNLGRAAAHQHQHLLVPDEHGQHQPDHDVCGARALLLSWLLRE